MEDIIAEAPLEIIENIEEKETDDMISGLGGGDTTVAESNISNSPDKSTEAAVHSEEEEYKTVSSCI